MLRVSALSFKHFPLFLGAFLLLAVSLLVLSATTTNGVLGSKTRFPRLLGPAQNDPGDLLHGPLGHSRGLGPARITGGDVRRERGSGTRSWRIFRRLGALGV